MNLLACFLLLVLPSLSLAAYQSPESKEKIRLPSGQTRTTYEFNGNAGEPTVTRQYVTGSGTTNQSIREWVADTIAELDRLQVVDGLPALQLGATPNPANRAAAVRTAKQTWQQKFELYLHIKDSGVAAISQYVADLKTWLEANYQAGFLDE